MPVVPSYGAPNVNSTGLPGATLHALPGLLQARQLQEAGQSVQQAGNDASRIALAAANQANQLRVDEALNKAKEAAQNLTFDKDVGFTTLKGVKALDRPDGQPLAEEYSAKLREQIGTLSAGLGNDAQRQAFALHANDILTAFHGTALRHESSEFKAYGLSVAEGIQATALRDISLNWRDPAAVASAVDRIQAETYRQAQFLGKSAEWQEAQARKLTSDAHRLAALTALEQNDVAYADAYLKHHSGQMDAADILAVRGHITKEVDTRVGLAAAGDVMRRFAPRINTSDVERAFNVAVGTESNHRQFAADGTPLTSPKGAVGIAQVMPDTAPEAAKLAGLPWDEHRYRNDADYNKALGLAYFQKQLQDNGGDLHKAWAAYNAGPGRLQEAMKKAEQSAKLNKNDPAVPVRTWLDFMPAETRAYVAKNQKAFESGQGVNAKPTLQDVHAAALDRLGPDASLGRRRAALEESTRLYSDYENALKQRDEEAVATAMRGIVENGGRFSDLPVAIRSAVPPKEVDNLIGFAQKIAKGDDSTSLWLYNKLTGNPGALARMSDNEFYALRRELSESDFKHFSNERAKLTGGAQGSNGPGDLNTQAIKQSLDERLRMLRIDPSPKDDGGRDAERIGGIRKFVNDYFAGAQREAGKKFSDAEVSQHLDRLFATNATMRGWFSNSSGPMLGMKIGDLPSGERAAIEAAFKRRGVDNPTEAQVMDVYWKGQTLTRK